MSDIVMVHETILFPTKKLRENPKNAAKHPPDQVSGLVKLFKRYGFIGSVIVGTGDVILAGHGRVMAAKLAGMDMIPVTHVGHLSRDEQDAYMIAENKSSELKTWDEDLLQSELERLCELDFDLDELVLSTLDEFIDAIPGEHEERKDGAVSPDDDFETDEKRDKGLWPDEEEYCEACGQKIVEAA